MAQFFEIHPHNPQRRLIKQAVAILIGGGVIIYPTDSCYALGCHIGDKKALDRIRRIRKLDESHEFALMCSDLSQTSRYVKVNNEQYRLLKSITPGPFTFVLPATKEVPKRLQCEKRKTIGLRVPDSAIVQMLLSELGEPIYTTTLILPGKSLPMNDAYEIREQLEHQVDLVIDGGSCEIEPTTVLDMTTTPIGVIRQGRGQTNFLETND